MKNLSLNDPEKLIRQVIAASPSIAMLLSPDYKILEFNPEAEAFYGKKRQEVLGRNYLDTFLTESQRQAVADDIEKALWQVPSGRFDNEVPADNQRRIVSWNVSRVMDSDDKPVGVVAFGCDITQYKEAEEASQSEKDRLQSLADGLSRVAIGVDIVSVDYDVLWQNQLLVERFGQCVGKKCFKVYMGLTEPCEFCPMRKATETNCTQTLEIKGGDGRDYELLSSPLQNPDGTVDRVIEVVQDITERKKIEEQVRDEKEFTDKAINALIDTFFVFNPGTGKAIRWNENFSTISGYTDEEISVMKAPDAYYDEDDLERAGESLKDIKDAGSATVGLCLITKNGRKIPFEYRVSLIEMPNGENVAISIGRDITGRKQIERSLRMSLGRNKAILASVSDIIAEVDNQKRYTWLNKAGLAFFGDDAIGKEAASYFEGEQHTYEIVAPLFEGGEDIFCIESWQRRKDGEKRLLAWWCHVLKDAYDNVTGAISTARDITEQRKTAEEREELLKTLSFRNKELQSIVYTASHDLKSPLVNIQGFSGELDEHCRSLNECLKNADLSSDIRKKIELLTEEYIPESLTFIKAGVIKMKELLDGFLRVSRIGRTEVTKEKLDMNILIASIVSAMRFQIDERSASVEVDQLPPCYGDANQLNQVFSNLIDNSLKYLDPKRKPVIRISGRTDESSCTYCVEDNGIGIDPMHQEKVFEIFHRLNPDSPISGEGLGLTIASRIIDRHDGRIWLESEPDRGCKCYVSLPTA